MHYYYLCLFRSQDLICDAIALQPPSRSCTTDNYILVAICRRVVSLWLLLLLLLWSKVIYLTLLTIRNEQLIIITTETQWGIDGGGEKIKVKKREVCSFFQFGFYFFLFKLWTEALPVPSLIPPSQFLSKIGELRKLPMEVSWWVQGCGRATEAGSIGDRNYYR